MASCSPSAIATCELTPKGVYLFVGEDSDLYDDVVGPLRDGLFEDVIQSASARDDTLSKESEQQPLVCKVEDALPRATTITFSPRSDRHVGAVLDVHFDEHEQVKVVGFYVVPLAP